jgi:tetratricopeptide (TPR) repeat protein
VTGAALLALALALAGEESGPVVVVPPEGPGGAGAGWIGAAVAEALPRALQRAGVPAVPGSDWRRGLEAIGVPGGSATRATAIRVAETLGASRLVVGSWDSQGSELSLSLRLLDARRGTLSAPLVARGSLAGLGRAVHALAWDVALAGPRPPTGTREALLAAADGVTFEALRALGEGLAGRDSASRVAGVRRALALDASFDEAALALSRLLVDAGSFAEARQAAARVSEGSPFAREALFLDGVALLGLGRNREADVLFAELASQQASAAALGNRAVARLRQGPDASGASTLLRQAVEAQPASVDLPFDLGWALLLEGEAEAAAFWLKGAVHRDPGDAQGRLVLSWALSASGRAEEAEEQWRAAVALLPALEPMRKPDLSRRLERVLPSEQGLVQDPARSADAEASRAHAAKGESLLVSGDREGAVSELARAALLDPYATRPHRLLGRAHATSGDDEKALAELRMALWCRDDPALRREIAELLRSMGRGDEARRVLGEP